MPKKRKTTKRTSGYKPVFTNTEHKLMQDYGVGNLIDEIGINRVMLMRLLDKMNQEMENLSFRDHLEATRAVSYTTGRIAHLAEVRERLYKPYLEAEKRSRDCIEQVHEITNELGILVFGQEKWDMMELEAAIGAMNNSGKPNKMRQTRWIPTESK